MHQPLKYYSYISDTKVDQLYAQIPRNLLKGIAAELTIDLKPLGAGLGTTIRKEQTQETRYSKIEVVVKYLEKYMPEDIGWIDAPQAYFKGMLPMFYGLIPTRNNIKAVYFGGTTGKTILGLGGSAYHVIGKNGDASIGEPSSDLPSLIAVLNEELQLQPSSQHEYFFDKDAALDAVEVMAKRMKGTTHTFEFLAKRLAYDPGSLEHGRIHPRPKPVLFGTPLYVALAE